MSTSEFSTSVQPTHACVACGVSVAELFSEKKDLFITSKGEVVDRICLERLSQRDRNDVLKDLGQYSFINHAVEINPHDTCPDCKVTFCQLFLQGKQIKITNCGHFFDKECLEARLRSAEECEESFYCACGRDIVAFDVYALNYDKCLCSEKCNEAFTTILARGSSLVIGNCGHVFNSTCYSAKSLSTYPLLINCPVANCSTKIMSVALFNLIQPPRRLAKQPHSESSATTSRPLSLSVSTMQSSRSSYDARREPPSVQASALLVPRFPPTLQYVVDGGSTMAPGFYDYEDDLPPLPSQELEQALPAAYGPSDSFLESVRGSSQLVSRSAPQPIVKPVAKVSVSSLTQPSPTRAITLIDRLPEPRPAGSAPTTIITSRNPVPENEFKAMLNEFTMIEDDDNENF